MITLLIPLLTTGIFQGQNTYSPEIDSLKSAPVCRIHFIKKRKFWFANLGKFVEYEKLRNWDARPCYLDMDLPLKEREYKEVGLLYYRFERYCRKNQIYYNKKELLRYRTRAILAGSFFFLACGAMVPVAIDAENYWGQTKSPGEGINDLADYLTGSPNAPLLWSLLPVEILLNAIILTNAEKALAKRIFLVDSATIETCLNKQSNAN
jgi:hypothetical protein